MVVVFFFLPKLIASMVCDPPRFPVLLLFSLLSFFIYPICLTSRLFLDNFFSPDFPFCGFPPLVFFPPFFWFGHSPLFVFFSSGVETPPHSFLGPRLACFVSVLRINPRRGESPLPCTILRVFSGLLLYHCSFEFPPAFFGVASP